MNPFEIPGKGLRGRSRSNLHEKDLTGKKRPQERFFYHKIIDKVDIDCAKESIRILTEISNLLQNSFQDQKLE